MLDFVARRHRLVSVADFHDSRRRRASWTVSDRGRFNHVAAQCVLGFDVDDRAVFAVSCSTMVSPVLSVSEAGRLVFELALEVEVMVAVAGCSEARGSRRLQHRLLDPEFLHSRWSHPFPAES